MTEHNTSNDDVNGVFVAWINRARDKKKDVERVIKTYKAISDSFSQYYSKKKWIFGSN